MNAHLWLVRCWSSWGPEMSVIPIAVSAYRGSVQAVLPKTVVRRVRRAALRSPDSRLYVDGQWSRTEAPLADLGSAKLVYVGSDIRLFGEEPYIRTPTSIPGRPRTFLALRRVLDCIPTDAMLIIDAPQMSQNVANWLASAPWNWGGLTLWNQPQQVPLEGSTFQATLFDCLAGMCGPAVRLNQLRKCISNLSGQIGASVEMALGAQHAEAIWSDARPAGPWGEDPRNASISRGSREDAIQALIDAATRPPAVQRQQARSSLLRIAAADPAPNVRAAAGRAVLRVSSGRAGRVHVIRAREADWKAALGSLHFLTVPAGRYEVGSPLDDPDGLPEERPRFQVHLPEFRLARTATPNAVLTALGMRSQISDPTLPATLITWFEAMEIARVLTRAAQESGAIGVGLKIALPSEVEWEAAAAGSQGRLHPWGRDFERGRCNSKSSGIDSPTVPGQFSPAGDGPYGHVDMAGNVWEWTRSAWGMSVHYPDYAYPYDNSDGRETDDRDVRRVVRGGAYYYDDDCLRVRTRNHFAPDTRHSGGGFRLAIVQGESE